MGDVGDVEGIGEAVDVEELEDVEVWLGAVPPAGRGRAARSAGEGQGASVEAATWSGT